MSLEMDDGDAVGEEEGGSEETVEELFDMIAALRMTFAEPHTAAGEQASGRRAGNTVVYHPDGTTCFGLNQDGRGVRCPYLSVNRDSSYVCTVTGCVYGQVQQDCGGGRFMGTRASENGERSKNQAPTRRFGSSSYSSSLLASERAFWLAEAARHEADAAACQPLSAGEAVAADSAAGSEAHAAGPPDDAASQHDKKRSRHKRGAPAADAAYVGSRRREQLMEDAAQMFRDVVSLGRTMHARMSTTEAEAPHAQRAASAGAKDGGHTALRATQAVRGRTHLHCLEAHLVTGLHRYAKQCSGSNTMPCLGEVCNKLYLIRREVKRTPG